MAATTPLSWAGSKTASFGKIIKHIKHIPPTITKYVEPFVGGGAFLFNILAACDAGELHFKQFTASDANPALIGFFINVRDDASALLQHLKRIEQDFNSLTVMQQSDYYFAARDKYNRVKHTPSALTTSALFMFLNKTAFGGLYRENSAGKFNVAFGGQHRKLKRTLDLTSAIAAASDVLRMHNVKFYVRDALKTPLAGIDSTTFVYLDPPYAIGKHNTFASYLRQGFSDAEQVALIELIIAMRKKGACVLMSNSDTPQLRKTARVRKMDQTAMRTRRSIASGKTSTELLVGFFCDGRKH